VNIFLGFFSFTKRWIIRCFSSEEFTFDKGDGNLGDPVAGVDGQSKDRGSEGHVGHSFRQSRLGNCHQFVHLVGIDLKKIWKVKKKLTKILSSCKVDYIFKKQKINYEFENRTRWKKDIEATIS